MQNDILPPAILVENQDTFKKMLAKFKGIRRLAVDSESNSLHAYSEKVCLIQFSTGKADYLLDTLADIDINALGYAFADPKIEKIFHAAEYDILCMKRDYGFEFVNLFDTMQAARILGIEKLGLANLLADFYAIDHPKGLQKADWAKRPLTPEMCSYARMDTHFLMQLRDTLAGQLAEKNLLELAREDFERLCLVEPNHNRSKLLYTQVSGFNKLNQQELRILDELCRYRDDLARKMDRPHFKVMENSLLLSVAQAQPVTIEALKKLDDVTPKVLERYGAGLAASVKRGLALTPIELEKRKRPPQIYLDRLKALQDWRKEAAGKMKVQSDIILPRDVLEQIAASRPLNLLELKKLMRSIPWRYSQFGSEILKVASKEKPA
jgi:ribonuclease D